MSKYFFLIKKYWSIVIKKASQVAEGKTGTKALIVITIFSAALALIAFLLGLFNIIPENTPYIGDAINNAGVQLGMGIIGIIVFAIVFVFALIYIPAKIYDEQGGFLENPFDLVTIPHDKDIQFGKQVWASIEIHNTDKRRNIEGCYLRLDQIIEITTKKDLLQNKQNLCWSGREHNPVQSGNQPIQVTAEDFRVCDVANNIPAHDKVEFTLWFERHFIDPGKYELAIRAYGRWMEHSINHPYYFILDYKGGNKLIMEKKVDKKP